MVTLKKPIAFLDFESTGLEIRTARICQIGVSKLTLDGELKTVKILVNPEMKIPKEATVIHGITDEMINTYNKGAPAHNFKSLAPNLLDYIKGCDLGGFNILKYDIPLLREELIRAKIDHNFDGVQYMDVSNIFRELYPRNLASVFKFYMNQDMDGNHDAGEDAKASANIFLKMIETESEKIGDGVDSFFTMSDSKIKRVDFAGYFIKDEEGQVCFNFGKSIGKVASKNKKFLQWMIDKGDFPRDTLEWAERIIEANKTVNTEG